MKSQALTNGSELETGKAEDIISGWWETNKGYAHVWRAIHRNKILLHSQFAST
jgi:hypothetical protein